MSDLFQYRMSDFVLSSFKMIGSALSSFKMIGSVFVFI